MGQTSMVQSCIWDEKHRVPNLALVKFKIATDPSSKVTPKNTLKRDIFINTNFRENRFLP